MGIPLYGQDSEGNKLDHARGGVKVVDSSITLSAKDSGKAIVIIENAGMTI